MEDFALPVLRSPCARSCNSMHDYPSDSLLSVAISCSQLVKASIWTESFSPTNADICGVQEQLSAWDSWREPVASIGSNFPANLLRGFALSQLLGS